MPVAAFLEWITLVLLVLAVASFAIARLKGKWTNAALTIGTGAVIILLTEGIIRVKAAIAPTTHAYPTYSSKIKSTVPSVLAIVSSHQLTRNASSPARSGT